MQWRNQRNKERQPTTGKTQRLPRTDRFPFRRLTPEPMQSDSKQNRGEHQRDRDEWLKAPRAQQFVPVMWSTPVYHHLHTSLLCRFEALTTDTDQIASSQYPAPAAAETTSHYSVLPALQ